MMSQAPKQGSRRARAFTFLEVLVVVAIIALLTAILLPSISRVRTLGKRTACLSNLKQIALAWHQYCDAHGGAFFQFMNASLNYGGKQGKGDPVNGLWGYKASDPNWSIEKPLNPFLKLPKVAHTDTEVFFCPADRGTPIERPTVYDHYGTSYMTNPWLIGQNDIRIHSLQDPCLLMKAKVKGGKMLKNMTRSRVTVAESKLLLVGDFGWFEAFNSFSTDRVEWHGSSRRQNMAFLDGHAEFLKIRKGLYVTPWYTLIPFQALQNDALDCQQEVGCE